MDDLSCFIVCDVTNNLAMTSHRWALLISNYRNTTQKPKIIMYNESIIINGDFNSMVLNVDVLEVRVAMKPSSRNTRITFIPFIHSVLHTGQHRWTAKHEHTNMYNNITKTRHAFIPFVIHKFSNNSAAF